MQNEYYNTQIFVFSSLVAVLKFKICLRPLQGKIKNILEIQKKEFRFRNTIFST